MRTESGLASHLGGADLILYVPATSSTPGASTLHYSASPGGNGPIPPPLASPASSQLLFCSTRPDHDFGAWFIAVYRIEHIENKFLLAIHHLIKAGYIWLTKDAWNPENVFIFPTKHYPTRLYSGGGEYRFGGGGGGGLGLTAFLGFGE